MDVVSILQKCEAMLTGHFLLSSGNHSSQYFQCAKLLQYPDLAAQVLSIPVQALISQKKEGRIEYDCVVGPAMGGIIPSYEFGRQLGVPSFFTERDDDGNMVLRRGFEVTKGMKIILAEDVISTGKSTLEAAKALEALGGVIVASACIVDRRTKDAENPFSWEIFSALRQPAVMYEPSSCLLCTSGELPLVKPGSRKKF